MTPPTDHPDPQREALRRAARERRAALTPSQRQAAARAVCERLMALPALRQARAVAAYSAHGDELDLTLTIRALHAAGKQVHLPRLQGRAQQRRMQFARLEPGTPLTPNRFGIGEPPAEAATIAPRFLQVVLLPLVAFDEDGARLGTGGGYYDRCFAFRGDRSVWHMPQLIGVGFECQAVPAIPQGGWDVPLDAVVTETRVWERR